MIYRCLFYVKLWLVFEIYCGDRTTNNAYQILITSQNDNNTLSTISKIHIKPSNTYLLKIEVGSGA